MTDFSGGSWRSLITGDTVYTIPDSAIFQTRILSGGGTTLVDEINGNDGSINGPSWVSDSSAVDGFELSFDGSGFVNFGEPAELDLNAGPITIIATVSSTGTGSNQAIIGKVNSQDTRGYTLYINPDGYLEWYDSDGASAPSNTAIDDGNKHRVVAQQAADGSVAYYVDGQSDGTASGSGSYASGSNLYFGDRQAGGWGLNGNLDNVIITDDLLSVSKIQSDYNSQPWS